MIPEHGTTGEPLCEIDRDTYTKVCAVYKNGEFYASWADWPSTPAYVIHTKQQIIAAQDENLKQTRADNEALRRELKALQIEKDSERVMQQVELNRLQCEIARIQAANVQLATGGVPLTYAMERAQSVNGTHEGGAYAVAPAH